MSDKGTVDHPVKNHSLIYAAGFRVIYLVVFWVILDLYPAKNEK